MSIQVHTFSDKKIKKLLANADPELRDYIAAQQHALDGYKDTLAQAMKKIFELSAAGGDGISTDDSSLGSKMLKQKD